MTEESAVQQEYSNVLLSFTPDALLSHLNETERSDKSDSWFRYGACMLVDISGFTQLSGQLCETGGEYGLDELRQITSGYLSQLLCVVYANGGDGKECL